MPDLPGRRKILIIDDQPVLARAITRMLVDHDVTAVENAREALGLIERGERYDVILSDLMMPELSGMELHALLAHVAPEQVGKMIFMTGGAFTDESRDFFDQVDNLRIQKPFGRASLIAVIETLLR